ncbi:hypothetical protein EMCRGX_G034150 [Ephydatia muelleri]
MHGERYNFVLPSNQSVDKLEMPEDPRTEGQPDYSKTVLFDNSKRELFSPSSGYKTLQTRLKVHWSVGVLQQDITLERLAGSKLVVFGGPREKFSVAEFDALRKYIDNGGSVLILTSEGGEAKNNTNINFLLEEYGVMANNDAVSRVVYYKYFHPKEALVSNGILNREINKAAGKFIPGQADQDTTSMQSVSFIYPYGCTLTVQKPAIAVLSSGSTSYPLNRPICAFCQTKGKLAVIGSAHLFHDQYIDKEENSKLQDVIFRWLTTSEIPLNSIDGDDPEILDYHFLPVTHKMAENVRACLLETEEVPRDFSLLFNQTLAYDELHTKHDVLTLISPQFDTPLPPLQPAVFPPTFHELASPALDLFDLDEHFSSERARLAQVTNKCSEEDLEYYVRECGSILGVTSQLPAECHTAKHILEHIFTQIVEFKKLNQASTYT